MSLDKWLFSDPGPTTLTVTLEPEDLAQIDDAVERLKSLNDREDFVFWAVQYVLDSLREESESLMAGLEE
jgi:hypothetical protein